MRKVLITIIASLLVATGVWAAEQDFGTFNTIPLLNVWVLNDDDTGIYLRDTDLDVLIGASSTTTDSALEVHGTTTSDIYCLDTSSPDCISAWAEVTGVNNWEFGGPTYIRPTSTVGTIVSASSTLAGTFTAQDIRPSVDSTYNLGTNALAYANGYFDLLSLRQDDDSATLSADNQYIYFGAGSSDPILLRGGSGTLELTNNTVSRGITIDTEFTFNNGLSVVKPEADGGASLGRASFDWNDLFIEGDIATANHIASLQSTTTNAIEVGACTGASIDFAGGDLCVLDDAQVEGTIFGNLTGNVTGNADTATALAANGANCAAGEYPLGVDASGVSEGCSPVAGSGNWQFFDATSITPTSTVGVLVTSSSTITHLSSERATTSVQFNLGDDVPIYFDDAKGVYAMYDTGVSALEFGGNANFGVDGIGSDVNFFTDDAGSGLTWDASPASASDAHMLFDVYDGQMVYLDITGTNAATLTSSKGHINIDVTLSGSYSTLQGANALYFNFNDGRNISGASGATFTRVASGRVNRTGTHSGSGAAEATQMLYMEMGDSMTLSGTATVNRTYLEGLGVSSQGVSSTGATTANNRGVYYRPSYLTFITGGGTHTFNMYGFDFAPNYNEFEVSGTSDPTVYGFYYHPAWTSAPTTEAVVYASRSGIVLASDATSGTDNAGGYFRMGASEDWERWYDSGNIAYNNIPTGASFVWQVNGSDEMTVAANALTFNNGATDTGFGWATSGQLDFDIGGTTEVSLAANTFTFNSGASDPVLDWATDGILDVTTGDFEVSNEFRGSRHTFAASLAGSIPSASYLSVGSLQMNDNRGWRMPRDGSIVSISINTEIVSHSVNGDMAAVARLNGTGVATTTVAITGDGYTGGESTQARGTDTFSAGDILHAYVSRESGTFTISGPIMVIEVQFDS